MQQVSASAVALGQPVVELGSQFIKSHRHSFLQRRRRAYGQEIVYLADRVRHFQRSDDPTHSPPGYAEGLRSPADGDRSVSHLRQRGDGDVISLETDMLVDLIGNRDCIVSNAQLSDGLQLRSGQYSACRIAGSVDDDGSGL